MKMCLLHHSLGQSSHLYSWADQSETKDKWKYAASDLLASSSTKKTIYVLAEKGAFLFLTNAVELFVLSISSCLLGYLK